MIVLGGMIGVGKTTMSNLLAKSFNSKVYTEEVENNPILPLFYTASKKEIEKYRYPFLLQLYFLNSRFKKMKEAQKDLFSIVDRSIYEDWYFAKVNKDLGRINHLEFNIYEDLFSNLIEEIKSPDLMVYLTASFETIMEHINKRGRAYEKEKKLIEYFRILWKDYDDWLKNHYIYSDVIILDMDRFDVINKKDDQIKVIKMIKDKL